jgi:hypothetical protein
MLAWYQSQAVLSDATIERRLDKEPFDFRWHTEVRPDVGAIRPVILATPRPGKSTR